MNAGAYRELVVIERNTIIEDEIGNQTSAWTKYYAGYAYMNNLSGSEYWEAAQTKSQNTIMFVMRYHALLGKMNTKEYRLIHRGQEYNITSVDNVQYKNEVIKIRAVAKG